MTDTLDTITLERKSNGSWTVTTRNSIATALSATKGV